MMSTFPSEAAFVRSPDSDQALVERFVAANDQAAFAAIVDRHGPMVLGVCRRVVRDDHLADDAFQATFLALARKADTLRDPAIVSSWLFATARQIAQTSRRTETRPAAGSQPPGVAGDRIAPSESLQLLDDELARLPDRYRAPILACHVRRLNEVEAVAILGWTASTLRQRLERGRELLRSRLGTRGADLGEALAAGVVIPDVTAILPAALRAQAVESAAGGAVSPAVHALAIAAPQSALGPKVAMVAAAAVVLVGVAWALTRALPTDSSAPARPPGVSGPKLIVESILQPEPMAAAWKEPLPTGAVARLGSSAFRHGTDGPVGIVEPFGVWQLAFRPDGTLVSAGGGRVRTWDPDTGRELDGAPIPTRLRRLLRSHLFAGGRYYALPDADELGNAKPSVTIWDVHERRPTRAVTLAAHAGRKSTIVGPTAVAADGSRFAEVDGNGDAWVWDANGAALSKLSTHLAVGTPLLLTPDGKTAITADGPHWLRTWDAATGAMVRDLKPDTGRGDGSVLSATMSPDGRWVAVLGMYEGPGPGGRRVWESLVRFWDLQSGQGDRAVAWNLGNEAPRSPVRLAFASDSTSLVGVGAVERDILRLARWPIPDGPATTWRAHARGLNPVAVAYDSKRDLMAVGGQGVIRLFDLAAAKELVPGDGNADVIRRIEFVADGVHTYGVAGEARAWDADTGRSIALDSAVGAPERRAWSNNSGRVVLDPDGPARKPLDDIYAELGGWPSLVTALPPARRPAGVPDLVLKCLATTSDGSAAVVGMAVLPPTKGEFGRVGVLEVATGKLRWKVAIEESAPASVQFSPDGSLVAVGTTKVRVYDARSGHVVATFDGHRGAVTALAFSPDGRRLASGSTDTTAVVWRVRE